MSLGVERFRGRKGYGDLRPWWAHEDREISDVISRGEKRARRCFWRRITATKKPDPIAALRLALGLHYGPLLDLQTQEAFDAYWTDALLREVAERWAVSRRTARCASASVIQARHHLEADAVMYARTLREIAMDPSQPAAARVRASVEGLAIAGVSAIAVDEIPQAIGSSIRITGQESVEQLEALLPQIAQLVPDLNRARLMTEYVFKRLAVLDPERHGTKVQHQMSGNLGVVAATLAEVRERKAAALAGEPVLRVLAEIPDAEDEAA